MVRGSEKPESRFSSLKGLPLSFRSSRQFFRLSEVQADQSAERLLKTWEREGETASFVSAEQAEITVCSAVDDFDVLVELSLQIGYQFHVRRRCKRGCLENAKRHDHHRTDEIVNYGIVTSGQFDSPLGGSSDLFFRNIHLEDRLRERDVYVRRIGNNCL